MKLVSSAEEEKAKKRRRREPKRTENLAHTIPANSELVSRECSGEKEKDVISSLPLFLISTQQACLVQAVQA